MTKREKCAKGEKNLTRREKCAKAPRQTLH